MLKNFKFLKRKILSIKKSFFANIDYSYDTREFLKKVDDYENNIVANLTTNELEQLNHILEKIEGSWMIDQEIFLYSKLNMHNSALDKLIKLGIDRNDFSKAETFCADMIKERADLFAQLFIILSKE
jgi:hypothetical protein